MPEIAVSNVDCPFGGCGEAFAVTRELGEHDGNSVTLNMSVDEEAFLAHLASAHGIGA